MAQARAFKATPTRGEAVVRRRTEEAALQGMVVVSAIDRWSTNEVTLDMAAENVRTVAKRLGVKALTQRDYEREGSFSLRTLSSKWGWKRLCAYAGVQTGEQHQPYSVAQKRGERLD